ncbi:MAG: hypothetical protein ABUS57_07310 [Pseudomonadota bacterium]
MKGIVPLAGPDFERADGVKATLPVDGEPLLRRALDRRAWRGALRNEDFVFVLRDSPRSRAFAETDLAAWYPGARRVYLSTSTQGAAFSTLAGLSLIAHHDEPISIDLADILFTGGGAAIDAFAAPNVGGAALVFTSQDPRYSYLRRDATGRIVEAAEKRVISDEASAGVYFFRSPDVLLQSIAHSLRARATLTFNGLFYVCPLFNGVLDQGLDVVGVRVEGVRDVK